MFLKLIFILKKNCKIIFEIFLIFLKNKILMKFISDPIYECPQPKNTPTLHFLCRKTLSANRKQQIMQAPMIAPMLTRNTDSLRISSGSSGPKMHVPSLSHDEQPPGQSKQL
jgi:hypothetical protein